MTITQRHDAPWYVSRYMARLFKAGLPPARYWALVSHMLHGAMLMDSPVTQHGQRELVAFPTDQDPPWGHLEVLLRTWPELVQLRGPLGSP